MNLPTALMIGTGEYTTGYVHGHAAGSDKSAGVVALTLFDLRRRGKVGQLKMAGTRGTKFPGIRQHVKQLIRDRYVDMDVSFDSFPAVDVERDAESYVQALDTLVPGDLVTVFTPDDTHFEIALAAVQRGCHVLVAKPLVKTLDEHRRLIRAAAEQDVLVAMEVHKRWDPIYVDARDRIRRLGAFSFFQSYMSQPKTQLDTFRSWAGRSSDISYYLNAHHVDFNCWSVLDRARPVAVSAMASTGVASGQGIETEDTITLTTQWENLDGSGMATAIYTSSWIAPRSDVHSQQRFFYMGHEGEITVDQAHRGYAIATDVDGFTAPNPLFMKYTPSADGQFAGQTGYGYRSLEDFVDAVTAIRAGTATAATYRNRLATVEDTLLVTAILEAGRRSLDTAGARVQLDYASSGEVLAIS